MDLEALAAEVEATLDNLDYPSKSVEALARYAAAQMRANLETKDGLRWHQQVLACVRLCHPIQEDDPDRDATEAKALAALSAG